MVHLFFFCNPFKVFGVIIVFVAVYVVDGWLVFGIGNERFSDLSMYIKENLSALKEGIEMIIATAFCGYGALFFEYGALRPALVFDLIDASPFAFLLDNMIQLAQPSVTAYLENAFESFNIFPLFQK